MKRIFVLIAALAIVLLGFGMTAPAQAGGYDGDKPSICHPVNGKGELGNGWNLISPDKASSHIDESLYPDGHYWKHESNDGLRHDQYAVNGTCPGEPVDGFTPYETQVCWTMSHTDGVENTYQFPQTRGCDYQPKCEETVEFQHDTYWIRDQADEDYLAGLTGLNSPADDAQLEPHDYYSVVKHGAETCPPTTVELPAAPSVTDPCGPGNATWDVPADTDALDWNVEQNGDLTVTLLTPKTVFPDGTTFHNFGKAPETNTETCPYDLPHDAYASLGQAGPGCTHPGSVYVLDLRNATLVGGFLDGRVGGHIAVFKADEGHLFTNGTDTDEISYNIERAHPEDPYCQNKPPHHKPPHHNAPPAPPVKASPPNSPPVTTVLPNAGLADHSQNWMEPVGFLLLLAGLGLAASVLWKRRA